MVAVVGLAADATTLVGGLEATTPAGVVITFDGADWGLIPKPFHACTTTHRKFDD